MGPPKSTGKRDTDSRPEKVGKATQQRDVEDDEPVKKGRGGTGPRQVDFSLSMDKSDGAYSSAGAVKVSGGPAEQPERSEVGYVAQVPTHLGGAAPAAIAAKYEAQAFDHPAEARQRLAVSVGVNAYRDVDDANRGQVAARVAAGNSTVRGRTFGFLWEPVWQKTVTENDVPLAPEAMTATQVAADPDAAQKKREAPGYFAGKEQHGTSGVLKQAKIPYGRIRDHIKDHDATAELMTQMRAQHKNVYVHVGDDDAQSMKALVGQGVRTGPATEARGLLSRYDAILAEQQRQTGKLPLLATGGYEFKSTADGGDVEGPNSQITLLAHQLDRRIREILVANLGAYAVYFPEPNTLYLATAENTRFGPDDPAKPIFHDPADVSGGGSGESSNMVAKLRELNPGGDAVYDGRASVTTQTSTRFQEGEGHFGKAKDQQAVDPVLVKHVVGQNQSHAASGMWENAVAQGTAGSGLSRVFIRDVFQAYTATGKLFDRKSQKKWESAEFRAYLTGALAHHEPAALAPKHAKAAKTDKGQAVIAAAQASNTAILAEIQRVIGLVSANPEYKNKL